MLSASPATYTGKFWNCFHCKVQLNVLEIRQVHKLPANSEVICQNCMEKLYPLYADADEGELRVNIQNTPEDPIKTLMRRIGYSV